jgi:uncharacterized membrane protein YqiK
MAQPQRRIPVRKPTVVKTKKFLVRMWEVERQRGSVPAQIRGFEVMAESVHLARRKVRDTIQNDQRRVLRSLSMTTDQVFTAVVFKNEIRVEKPVKPNEFPMVNDGSEMRREIAGIHRKRRAKTQETKEQRDNRLAKLREERAKERRAKIAASRKKQAAEAEQARLKRQKVVEAERAERQAKRHESRTKKAS